MIKSFPNNRVEADAQMQRAAHVGRYVSIGKTRGQ
jgi:hypothetical protein